MRILHTSDWHLGRSFGEHRLLEDQARFVDWLVQVVADERIDLVVVAGDLYDRSVPPAEAVELLAEAFRRLRAAGAEVAAIAGNHDSPERVAAFDGLTDAAGVVMRGGYRRAAEVAVRHFADGPLAVVAVPFLDPLLAPAPLRDDAGRRPTHESVLAATLDAARARLGGMRSVVLGHAFVTGAHPSSSERDLAVGAAAMVSAQVFHGFDYVALGHLHRPQAVGPSGRVRYSGAPLAYSFSETAPKEVTLVELSPAGAADVRSLPVPVGRPVHTLRGAFQDLLDDPGSPAWRHAWLRVELTDPVPVVDAHRRLRQHFPHLVEIARVAGPSGGGAALTTAQVRQRTTADLSAHFWADVTGRPPSPPVASLLADALASAVSGGSP